MKNKTYTTSIFSVIIFFCFIFPSSSSGNEGHGLIRTKAIPMAQINIDGKFDDWEGISPVYSDAVGDNLSLHSGCDIKNIYVSKNLAKNTLYIAFEMTKKPNNESAKGNSYSLVQYCVAFDDFRIDSYSTGYHDWQIGIDRNNNFWVWDLRKNKSYADYENMTWYESSTNSLTKYAQDNFIEFSVPVSIINLPESFAIRAYLVLRDAQNTIADSMNYDVTLSQKPSAFSLTLNNIACHEELLKWMKGNLNYGWPGDQLSDPMSTWIYKSPDEVFYSGRGDCVSQSGFAAYALKLKGYSPSLLFVDRIKNSDHAVCYWKESEGYFYIENAFYGNEGIHGPYVSVGSIGHDVYLKLVASDGQEAQYQLFDMNDVPYGLNWPDFLSILKPIMPNSASMPWMPFLLLDH
ncbi:MAG: hypothetical protein U5L00_13590 [Desulfovermiculus sp.]|nr:hypothetical protein [Desulfovermiculus sp.]